MPTAEDGKLLRDLIHDADALYWDTQNEVLIFGTVKYSEATNTGGPGSLGAPVLPFALSTVLPRAEILGNSEA